MEMKVRGFPERYPNLAGRMFENGRYRTDAPAFYLSAWMLGSQVFETPVENQSGCFRIRTGFGQVETNQEEKMNTSPDDYGTFYRNVMRNGLSLIVFAAVLFAMIAAYRIAGFINPQPVVFMKQADQTGFSEFERTVFLPGGLDYILQSPMAFLISGPIMGVGMGLVMLLLARTNHRLADITAFSLVDQGKIDSMGKRVRWSYGAAAFAFALAAFSLLFDVSLTLSMYLGDKPIWGLGTWLLMVGDYAWAIVLAGLALSVGFGLWWGKTVEYPRPV